MKRKGLILFLFLMSVLSAEEEADFFDAKASKEYIIDERQNYFRTSTDYKITPTVNPITGEYCQEELDLIVAGSQPISIRRFYNSNSPEDPRYANWRYNPEAFFAANLEWQGQEIFAAVGNNDGTICSLKPSANLAYTFDFQIPKNLTASGSDGTSHPLNIRFDYWKNGDPKDKRRFEYRGAIIDGSGRKRFFISPMHRWTHIVHWREKIGKWWQPGTYEKLWEIYPNTWTPYHVPIVEEKLPNGNILCYTYTEWQKEEQNYPLPRLLSSITAYNADKSQVLGFIHLDYPRVKHREVGGIQITGSDDRIAVMKHSRSGKSPIQLASAKQPGQPSVSYAYHNTTLNSVTKPDGRGMTITYNADGKVSAQNAPVGSQGEMCPIGRYEYHDKLTIFYDAENNKINYRYDEDKKLTCIETYQDNVVYRIDRFIWDPSTGNLNRKIVEDSTGNPLHITEYKYDKNQNPVLERIGNGNEWRTLERTYSDDGFNLKLTETDRADKRICYAYVPQTNLLSSELTYEGNLIRKRIFHFYDNCAICIKTIVDDGITNDPNNLQGVTYRKITEFTPKKTLPCFGLPEMVAEKTINSTGQEMLLHKTCYTYTPFGKILQEDHYDAGNIYHHSISNSYDDKERLISTANALGNLTQFTYDANHNLLSIIGPQPGQCKEMRYDKANRPIRMIDRQTDGTLLSLERKYDKLGRLVAEVDVTGNTTRFQYDSLSRLIAIHHPDGAVEKKAYNVLGHLIKETDALGYETTKTYNPYGQVISVCHPDGTEESFAYNATGTLHSHKDRNGVLTTYRYDIFDQVIETDQIFKKTAATYTPFCKLSETDGEGITTHYSYDFCGRKVAEQTDVKKTTYTYNPAGLLEITDHQFYRQTDQHDSLGRLIVKLLACEKIQFEEHYAYDEASHPTHRITSQGVFETCYNTQGLPLREINPLGYVTQYAYDFDKLYSTTITDANHVQTRRIHDQRGREIQCIKTDDEGNIISKNESAYDYNGNLIALTHSVFDGLQPVKTITHQWEYGPQGRLETFTEAGEKKTCYLYDKQGRLKTIIKPSGIQLHHEYDPLGRLSRYYSSDFNYSYAYDCNDHLVAVNDSVAQQKTARVYNALGGIVQEKLANQLQLTNVFDSQGRRIRLILPDTTTIDYTYQGAFLYKVSHKGQDFTYQERDLEGYPIALELPSKLGTVAITRDPLSRIAKMSSPFYTTTFSKASFDGVGNLLHYDYKDPAGQVECNYSYDSLNQLISENTHSYRFDSIYNRLEKDGVEQRVNNLCQVLNDDTHCYEYDCDGNLVNDGQWRYRYDTQDRLIGCEHGKHRIEYTYDPFHRRLSKRVFLDGKCTEEERYLWDGEHEIGVVNTKGALVQLRVLGEGLGAEIGAAVLCELNGKSYVPLHDHRGSLAVLIDVKTSKPAETYRYTAFGEELLPTTLSPWRFSSKRVEKETGLVFFGRRYYLPTGGRWITQDPQGYDDGPNLYAYLSNCPLTSVDPYGLMGLDAYSFPNWSSYSFGTSSFRDHRYFEDNFSNKSRTFSLNNDFNYNFPEPAIGAYLFGNGVGNTFGDLGEKARMISNFSGYNTRGVYNATHGVSIDVSEAMMNLMEHAMTPPVYCYHQEWDHYFDSDLSGAPLWQGCHSQATVQVRNALETYSKERRERIIVAAFAPFAYIPKELCMQVNHYVCPSDPVTYFDFKNKRGCAETITYVPRMPNCKQSCHEFLNPIYLPYLKKEITRYQTLLEKYDH